MLITVRHEISDRDTFWHLAAQGIAHTPRGFTIHEMRPASDVRLLTCVWEAPSVESLSNFMEGTVGHVSANTYAPSAICALRGDGRPLSKSEVGWIRQAAGSSPALDVAEARTFLESALAEVIERFAMGVVLTDAAGRPCVLNAAARRICGEADGFLLQRDVLRATSGSEDAALRRAIATAGRAATDGRPTAGEVLTVSRPSGRSALSLLVVPLSKDARSEGPRRPVAAVFITDPGAATALQIERLQPLYDLTRTEARIAALVAEGLSAGQVAARLGVSLNTTRWHLKHVFLKCGADSQRDLVRRVLSSPAALR